MQTVDSVALEPRASERTMQMKLGSGAGVLGKRSADESKLNDDDRFAKRLNRLSLDRCNNNTQEGNGNHTLPISNNTSLATHGASRPLGKLPQTLYDEKLSCVQQDSPGESMLVDDTRDRVYIHDLDQELAEVESSEETDVLIFLPDIERRFSRIPPHVLRGKSTEHDAEGQEMVLYGAPKSLTVDESHDSVRKAIIEARARARDKAVEDARLEDMNRRYGDANDATGPETAHGYSSGYGDAADGADPDAMEIE